jgi:hypothetical protein
LPYRKQNVHHIKGETLKPLLISFIVFALVLVGSLLGMAYRAFLTEHHLSQETKEYVLTVGLELAGVIAAFVLALAVTGAQGTFDEQRNELIAESANIVFLHKILVNYGPESNEARNILRRSLVHTIDEFWPSGSSQPAELQPNVTEALVLYEKILLLKPQNESQRSLRQKALDISFNLEQSRDLLIMQQNKSIPVTFLIVLGLLVIWFVFIFFSLGIYAPLNSTAIFILVLSALSVSIAFFMIVDLSLPFEGALRMPSAPLREALQYIGK